MDKKTLETIKQDLLNRRNQIAKELKETTGGDNKAIDANFPQFGDKEDENASEVAAYSDNLSIEFTLQKTLEDIDKTLESIDKGTYGVCRYCKQPIDEKRLLARPTSSACVGCKNRLSKS
ncbi:MAG: TraR/DksA family transcriptional regulator [Patescibacteria group bacterium]